MKKFHILSILFGLSVFLGYGIGLYYVNNKFNRTFYLKDHETQLFYHVHLGEHDVTVKQVPKEEAESFIINPK